MRPLNGSFLWPLAAVVLRPIRGHHLSVAALHRFEAEQHAPLLFYQLVENEPETDEDEE